MASLEHLRQPAVADLREHEAGPPRFDRVARIYRAMEYLSFGPILDRCRFHPIPALKDSRRALIIGDGDGRFAARLLCAAPNLRADAIDASPTMLALLRQRVRRTGAENRLTTTCVDARSFTPPQSSYDLVATHFFLDCLTEPETASLITRLRPHLAPGARWLVSEFQVPAKNCLGAWLAGALISALYAAFRLLTGLTVRKIPPWQSMLARNGFTRKTSQTWLGGLVVSELWQLPEATGSPASRSHKEMTLATQPNFSLGSIPGIDPGPEPFPGPPPVPTPDPAPGPKPDPDPEPYPGPIPAPQPVT